MLLPNAKYEDGDVNCGGDEMNMVLDDCCSCALLSISLCKIIACLFITPWWSAGPKRYERT